jgi:hypothetical protein
MELYSARWLRKGFTSDKVVFVLTIVENYVTKIPYQDPCVITRNFEFCRPTGPANTSLPVILKPGMELQMYPRLRGITASGAMVKMQRFAPVEVTISKVRV